MSPQERLDLVAWVEKHPGRRGELLNKLGIPQSTYYAWRKRQQLGLPVEGRPTKPKGGWNRLTEAEKADIRQLALDFTAKSARELAIWITDHRDFSVSESTVFRLLKREGLLKPRPVEQRPAEKEFRHKTKRPNEMWQLDGTQFKVHNWGFYKWLPILDDFSRRIITHRLKDGETAENATDVVAEALEIIGAENLPEDRKPVLLSDNGSAFKSKILGKFLRGQKVRQIHGAVMHPQTQGKVERLNRRIKEVVNLLVYDTPMALEAALNEAVNAYNQAPHEALENVSPIEMYEGRQEEILARRQAKKRWTIEMRKAANMPLAA
jgi:transposase InsO family protein